MRVLPVHMSGHHMLAWLVQSPEEGTRPPGTEANRSLRATMWVLRIELRSFGKTASALSHGAIFSAPYVFFFFNIRSKREFFS